jgi:hypothetical protein
MKKSNIILIISLVVLFSGAVLAYNLFYGIDNSNPRLYLNQTDFETISDNIELVNDSINSLNKPIDLNNLSTITAPIIIYKTSQDYYSQVPVYLDETKTKIVGYPDVKDVYYNGKLAYPTKLHQGYLLDNRGISKYSTFLNITYEEYVELDNISPSSLQQYVIKTNIVEMYSCNTINVDKGNISMLNEIIDTNRLSQCKQLI